MGTLRTAIETQTRVAIQSGALESIRTELEIVEQLGVRFVVRWVSSLERKAVAKATSLVKSPSSGTARNPFLPPDPALTVAELSGTHLAVLNKYNVLDHHLLMVTREFEHQESLLTRADFQALWTCLAEIDGLGFYNGGEVAGASQPHKHLQLVPLPLSPEGPGLPMDVFFDSLTAPCEISCIDSLPWRHRCCRLPPSLAGDTQSAVDLTLRLYRSMLEELEFGAVSAASKERRSAPYNLLVTRDFMAVIPRRKQCAHGISVNALGFAGSLFVPERDKLPMIRDVGPMNLLRETAISD